MNVLFVCHGNVCRSPLAAAFLKKKFKENKITGEVSSAGFESFNINEAPDPIALKIARKLDLELDHKAKIFRKSDFSKFDKIYVMEVRNYRDVKDLSRNEEEREKVDYLMNVIEPGKNRTIPDPYLSGQVSMREIVTLLDTITDKIVDIAKVN